MRRGDFSKEERGEIYFKRTLSVHCAVPTTALLDLDLAVCSPSVRPKSH